MIVVKFICLGLAIGYSFSCFGGLFRRQRIDAIQVFMMSFSWAAFICLQWVW